MIDDQKQYNNSVYYSYIEMAVLNKELIFGGTSCQGENLF